MMKKYTVYYREELRSGLLEIEVDAVDEEDAILEASKRTLINSSYLTTDTSKIYDLIDLKGSKREGMFERLNKDMFKRLNHLNK